MTTNKTTEAVQVRAAALRKLPRLTLQDMAREAGLSGWVGAKRDALALSIAQHEAGIVVRVPISATATDAEIVANVRAARAARAAETPPAADDERLLGLLLRLVRERRGVSRQVLAERMGQTPQAISELENGRPQERSLSAAARALGLTLEELLREGLAALDENKSRGPLRDGKG